MKKQSLIHLHGLFEEIWRPIREEIDDSDYRELDVHHKDILAGKNTHREAVFTLSETLAEELNPELVEELDPSYSEGELENILYTSSDGEEQVEETASEQEDTLSRHFDDFEIGKTEVRNSSWDKPDTELVESVKEVDDVLDEADDQCKSILKQLMSKKVVVSDQEEGRQVGHLEWFDPSLQRYGLMTLGMDKIDFESPEKIQLKKGGLELHNLDLDGVVSSSYAVKVHDPNQDYVEKVADRGSLVSLPLLREEGDRYEIVDGHKGVKVAQEADLDSQMCIVKDLSELEALKIFIDDHIPDPRSDSFNGRSWYDETEVEMCLNNLQEEYSDEVLMQIDRLKPYLEMEEVHEYDQVVEDVFGESAETVTEVLANDQVSDEYRERLRNAYLEGVSGVVDSDELQRKVRIAEMMPEEARAAGYSQTYWTTD